MLLTKAGYYYLKSSLRKVSACIYATKRRLWIVLANPTGVLVKLIFFMFTIWRPYPKSTFPIFLIDWQEGFFVFCDFLKNGSNDFFLIGVVFKCHKLVMYKIQSDWNKGRGCKLGISQNKYLNRSFLDCKSQWFGICNLS